MLHKLLHTTYLDINEPDLRYAKSVEEAVLTECFKCWKLTRTGVRPQLRSSLTTITAGPGLLGNVFNDFL